MIKFERTLFGPIESGIVGIVEFAFESARHSLQFRVKVTRKFAAIRNGFAVSVITGRSYQSERDAVHEEEVNAWWESFELERSLRKPTPPANGSRARL